MACFAHVISLRKGDAVESISKVFKRKSISCNSTHPQSFSGKVLFLQRFGKRLEQ